MKALAMGFALLAAALTAHAQEFPVEEAYVGFTYANVDLGSQASLFNPDTKNYYGFDVSYSLNPNRHLGLLADVSFNFGRTTQAPPPPFSKIYLQTTEALFGPRFTLRRDKATLFANALVGVANTRLQGAAFSSTYYEDLISQNDLTFGLGGGLDLNWKRSVAIRAFQFEYLPTRRSGAWTSTYTVTTGIVYKFSFFR